MCVRACDIVQMGVKGVFGWVYLLEWAVVCTVTADASTKACSVYMMMGWGEVGCVERVC